LLGLRIFESSNPSPLSLPPAICPCQPSPAPSTTPSPPINYCRYQQLPLLNSRSSCYGLPLKWGLCEDGMVGGWGREMEHSITPNPLIPLLQSTMRGSVLEKSAVCSSKNSRYILPSPIPPPLVPLATTNSSRCQAFVVVGGGGSGGKEEFKVADSLAAAPLRRGLMSVLEWGFEFLNLIPAHSFVLVIRPLSTVVPGPEMRELRLRSMVGWCRVHNTLDPDSRLTAMFHGSLIPSNIIPCVQHPLLLMVISPFLGCSLTSRPESLPSDLRLPRLPSSSMHLFLIPHWVHSHSTIPLPA